MKQYQPFLFNYNIPVDNHVTGRPDCFISVIAQMGGVTENKVQSFVRLVNPCLFEVSQVKNWIKATQEIEAISNHHFQRMYDFDSKLENQGMKLVGDNNAGWLKDLEEEKEVA